jgi:hypothetical protein
MRNEMKQLFLSVAKLYADLLEESNNDVNEAVPAPASGSLSEERPSTSVPSVASSDASNLRSTIPPAPSSTSLPSSTASKAPDPENCSTTNLPVASELTSSKGPELSTSPNPRPPKRIRNVNDDSGDLKMSEEERCDEILCSQIFDSGIESEEIEIPESFKKLGRRLRFHHLSPSQRTFLISHAKKSIQSGGLNFTNQDVADAEDLELNYYTLHNYTNLVLSHYNIDPLSRGSASVSNKPVHSQNQHQLDANAMTPIRHNLSAKHSNFLSAGFNDTPFEPISPPPNPIRLHNNVDMDSPLKDILANRPPKTSSQHFIGEEDVMGHTLERLHSCGPFEVRASREEFEDLIKVELCVNNDGEQRVTKLSWKKLGGKFTRTTKLTRILKQHQVFDNHLDPRFYQRGKVLASFDPNEDSRMRKPSRAGHNWAIWQAGKCAHNDPPKGPCSASFEFGIDLADIESMYTFNQRDIRVYGTITNDCLHIKHQLRARCAGVDREELRKAYSFSESGEYVGIQPKHMYERHKPGARKANVTCTKYKSVSNKHLHKVIIRSRKVAWKMSSEGSMSLLNEYNLSRTDTLANLYTAAQACKDHDAEARKLLLQQHGPGFKDVIGGDNYLGVLRSLVYDDVAGNRGTTPFSIQYFTLRGVQLYHHIARHGRSCIHIDGSKSRVKFGAKIKEGDKIQNWQMYLSPVFIQKSHSNDDPNKFLRQNFSPKLLTECHTANTSTKDIASFRIHPNIHNPIRDWLYLRVGWNR